MYTNIRSLHLMMSPTVEEYAQKRMLSLQRLVKDSEVVCDVQLSKITNHHRSGDIYRAEVSLHINKEEIYACSEKEDLYQAVDDVRDELEHILSSRKAKRMVKFRRGAARIKEMLKSVTPSFEVRNPFRKK